MRLEIHYRIAKKISAEMKELGLHLHESSFLFGNFFPDLIHSYFWCKHEYSVSRDFLRKKIERLKKKPIFFSFRLGVLTHYICDYFCYPHSSSFDKGLIHHITYEIKQKIPEKHYSTNLKIKTFSIEELDRFIQWYDNFRISFEDDESDFHIAAMVTSNFLRASTLLPAV